MVSLFSERIDWSSVRILEDMITNTWHITFGSNLMWRLQWHRKWALSYDNYSLNADILNCCDDNCFSNMYICHCLMPVKVKPYLPRRFTRLPFGLTCSPFLLCTSTRELAMKHISKFHIAASMIDKLLYMDDFLVSTETETHITMLYHEMKDLLTLMKLPMEKWSLTLSINCVKLKDVLHTNKGFRKSTTTVLGIDWDKNVDTL
ncbi:integrase catalytic domain-containing protein [Nephila pilipes]|uniref:Integrase catalytic domain-containing protein n=1 Tax=Nephila pilipes TaxID=299642 RepID=A0A8X6IP08_NEPPI|nr:integrase catalytic domain-containing protein [Nephila pilipes]